MGVGVGEGVGVGAGVAQLRSVHVSCTSKQPFAATVCEPLHVPPRSLRALHAIEAPASTVATMRASATASHDAAPPGSKNRRSVPTMRPPTETSIDDQPWLAVVEKARLAFGGAARGSTKSTRVSLVAATVLFVVW